MSNEQRRRSLRPVAVGLAALLVVAGAVIVIVALSTQRHAPQPPAAAATPLPTSTAPSTSAGATGRGSTAPSPRASTAGLILAAATPTAISIPAINVQSSLLQLGLNADHSVQVPPLEKDSKAGWYRESPTPGQAGPAVILGHVDSAEYGPGIFFRLGALPRGALVSVTRADHTVAVFRVDKVVAYPKSHFPTFQVYGNTANSQLRLITCGGKFDFSSHNYESNIVAYASLVSSHRA